MRNQPEMLLREVVDAWEALPGGRQQSVRAVESWLAADMKPVIDKVRSAPATPPAQGDAAQPGADAWKRSDYVVYDSGFGPINARVIGYVEGWVDLVFRDGSTAICRPSRISASPAELEAAERELSLLAFERLMPSKTGENDD